MVVTMAVPPQGHLLCVVRQQIGECGLTRSGARHELGEEGTMARSSICARTIRR